jgi:hypothetical protein
LENAHCRLTIPGNRLYALRIKNVDPSTAAAKAAKTTPMIVGIPIPFALKMCTYPKLDSTKAYASIVRAIIIS